MHKSQYRYNILHRFGFCKYSFVMNKYPKKKKKVYCTDLERDFSPIKNNGGNQDPKYLKGKEWFEF